jgi:hypothetical protein
VIRDMIKGLEKAGPHKGQPDHNINLVSHAQEAPTAQDKGTTTQKAATVHHISKEPPA